PGTTQDTLGPDPGHVADARQRRFDGVAVVKLDRLARHLVMLGAEWATALGVDLVALDQSIDARPRPGACSFTSSAASPSSSATRSASGVHAGLKAARRRGSKIGRPPSLDREERRLPDARARRS